MRNFDVDDAASPVEVLRAQTLDEVVSTMRRQHGYRQPGWAAFVMVARFAGTRMERLDAATLADDGRVREAVVARRELRRPLESLSVVMEGPAGQLPVVMVFTVRAADQAFTLEQAFPGDPRVDGWDVAARGLEAVAAALDPRQT